MQFKVKARPKPGDRRTRTTLALWPVRTTSDVIVWLSKYRLNQVYLDKWSVESREIL